MSINQYCSPTWIDSVYTVFRKKVIYLFLPFISHSFWTDFTKLSVYICQQSTDSNLILTESVKYFSCSDVIMIFL